GLVYLFEDPLAGRDIGATRIGQSELAAGAGEKPRLQMGLQIRNLAAHGGERNPEAPAGRRKAAGLNRGDEDGHRFQAIHAAFRILEGYTPFLPNYLNA